MNDVPFRDSVIRSNLSLADGMPVVWIARFLGIPVRTRVAGSTLFERLRKQVDLPINVFFFGGQNGVAEQAANEINGVLGKMRCVGACSPGFGTIEDMSSHSVIDGINDARPDFLLVALGAKRGQAWIEHNLASLDAPVISHLGAVINFVAGTISRAPAWIGGIGFEWLWRIKEEPALWRRYMGDAFTLLNLLFTRVIPSAMATTHIRRTLSLSDTSEITVITESNNSHINLSGSWCDHKLLPLRDIFQRVTVVHCHIRLDLEKVTELDSAFVGLLIILFGHQLKIKREFNLTAASPVVKRFLHLNCADYLIQPTAIIG